MGALLRNAGNLREKYQKRGRAPAGDKSPYEHNPYMVNFCADKMVQHKVKKVNTSFDFF